MDEFHGGGGGNVNSNFDFGRPDHQNVSVRGAPSRQQPEQIQVCRLCVFSPVDDDTV